MRRIRYRLLVLLALLCLWLAVVPPGQAQSWPGCAPPACLPSNCFLPCPVVYDECYAPEPVIRVSPWPCFSRFLGGCHTSSAPRAAVCRLLGLPECVPDSSTAFDRDSEAALIYSCRDGFACCPDDGEPRPWEDQLRAHLSYMGDNVWNDFTHFYSPKNLGCVALGVAVAAPLANTSWDDNFSRWYQRRVRSRSLDNVSDVVHTFGSHEVVVPIYMGLAAAGWLMPDYPAATTTGEWSRRTLRAMMVGAPTVGALQYGLGGSRPVHGSARWRPFRNDNSVSGHGFVGAVPFLTAASMTENRWAKGALYAGSFLTTWSRLNDDAHSLSQIMLGWWIAYLAVESVNRTEYNRNIIFAPSCQPDEIGFRVLIQY